MCLAASRDSSSLFSCDEVKLDIPLALHLIVALGTVLKSFFGYYVLSRSLFATTSLDYLIVAVSMHILAMVSFTFLPRKVCMAHDAPQYIVFLWPLFSVPADLLFHPLSLLAAVIFALYLILDSAYASKRRTSKSGAWV